MSNFEERRKDERIALIQEVDCESDSGKFRRRLVDISVGGMFVDCVLPFPVGEIARVRFRMPGAAELTQVTGRVVYVQVGIGMGIKFLDLKQEDRLRILDYAQRLSPKPMPVVGKAENIVRLKVNLPVTVMGSERGGARFADRTTLLTLSKNGACIRSTRNLEVGAPVHLDAPDGSRLEARVVWSGAEEIGLQSVDLAKAMGIEFLE